MRNFSWGLNNLSNVLPVLQYWYNKTRYIVDDVWASLGHEKMKFVMALWIRKISICVPFRSFELIDTGSCIDKGDSI